MSDRDRGCEHYVSRGVFGVDHCWHPLPGLQMEATEKCCHCGMTRKIGTPSGHGPFHPGTQHGRMGR